MPRHIVLSEQEKQLREPGAWSEDEKRDRHRAMRGYFLLMLGEPGLAKNTERLRLYLNQFAYMPFRLHQAMLEKAVAKKSDGFQTLHQPGELWDIAASCVESEHSPNGAGSVPRWFLGMKRHSSQQTLRWQLPAGRRQPTERLQDRAGATISGNGH